MTSEEIAESERLGRLLYAAFLKCPDFTSQAVNSGASAARVGYSDLNGKFDTADDANPSDTPINGTFDLEDIAAEFVASLKKSAP